MEMYTKEYIKNMESKGYTYVTPEKASEWLQHNTNNRFVRKKFISQLIYKIQEGDWIEDIPDHIAFYDDGTLANGQHRLLAISQAGIPVFTKIDYNIPKHAAIAIDTGKSRSVGDNIKILTGEAFYTPKITKMITITSKGGKNFTHEDHLYIATHYKDYIIFIKEIFNNTPHWMQQTSVMGALYLFLLEGADKDSIRKFVQILRIGRADTEYGEIVLRFRDLLQTEYFSRGTLRHNYADEIKRAENVFYNYIEKKHIKLIKIPDNYRVPLYDYSLKREGGENK